MIRTVIPLFLFTLIASDALSQGVLSNDRLIDEETLSGAGVTPDGLHLTAVTSGPETMSVVGTNQAVRAEEIVDRSIEPPTLIEHWGLLEEIAEKSEIESDKKTLTITAPDMYVDNYPPGKVNAPRVLREVSGDFSAEVNVAHIDEAEADSVHQSLGNFSTAYHSGTLLLRSDDATFVRLERVSMNSAGRSAYTCDLQIWKEKKRQFHRSFRIENKPTRLRLERLGEKLIASFSQDRGESWTTFPEQSLEGFPDKAKLGVSMTSNTREGCKVQFEGFKLEAKDD